MSDGDPFLFDDLAEPLPEPATRVYTTPIEQAVFDIMELVDGLFRASVTVEEYDDVQSKVKDILLEATREKDSDPSLPRKRPLLLVRHDPH